ncbi:hypothetical protein EG68_00916 [Paragonimus skrjabini miyazakii]|uniref:BEN domain-containing protein n=1 Tax=Paragonimus skrjabini miyazakii TaxID=59628 RepID=A0A8S9Z908_9TREM|nr:hypothetical protein EG68_00916 [Paragonimus skrjabini miyazakii]
MLLCIMPRGETIHEAHGISAYNDDADEGFATLEENYYYKSAKRKRKTNVPQKLEVSGDEMEDYPSAVHTSCSSEPINLINKGTENPQSPLRISSKNKEKDVPDTNFSVESARIYSNLLNYLLLKHQIPSENVGGFHALFGINRQVNNSSEPKAATFVTSSNFSHLNSGGFHHNLGNLTNDQFLHHSCVEDNFSPEHISALKTKHEESRKEAYLKLSSSCDTFYKQTIANAINACVHSIPIPKTGYNNYEAMLLCYKSLIEKAYSLQYSIDVYVNLLLNTPMIGPQCYLPTNGYLGSPNAVNFHPHSPSVNSSSQIHPPVLGHCLNTNFKTSVCDISRTNCNYLQRTRQTEFCINKCDLPINAFSSGDERSQKSERSTPLPVDLTKADYCSSRQSPQLPQLLQTATEADDYNEKRPKETSISMACFDRTNGCENLTSVMCAHSPQLYRSFDSTHLSPSEKFDFSIQNGGAVSFSSPSSLETNPLSTPSVLSQRKKSYFKTKRTKKSFMVGNTTTITNMGSSENPLLKKSNFRGTSEEENRVSPDFKPTEINGQILLCEAHPTVKLSKDIFYSLIVKSSGSATRLIRLLMKSFFTQDELAASSLSGEGIYKQRLEPSVTEAIKIFIRRRHPQLKTGSINLCMTDVCVQARRVANNQRSRQHPLRGNSFSIEGPSTHSEDLYIPDHTSSSATGHLGVKSRPSSNNRPTSANRLNKVVTDALNSEDLKTISRSESERDYWPHSQTSSDVTIERNDVEPKIVNNQRTSDQLFTVDLSIGQHSASTSKSTSFLTTERVCGPWDKDPV